VAFAKIEKETGSQAVRRCMMQVMEAFYELDGTGKTGAVIRNHDGCFLAGHTIWCNRATDPLLMEAMSCKDGT
jgi:hypothetical protein